VALLCKPFAGELPQLVLFDLDGTLLDSVPDLAAAVDHMLALRGRDPAGVERVRDWVGNGAAVLVARALAGDIEHAGVETPEARAGLQDFLAAYAGSHHLTRVYSGVISLLDWLQARQIPLAVVTNKPEQFVAPLLEQTGLAGYFRWLVGGDTLPRQKPDPAPLQHVLGLAGVAPERALFIGDSRNDVLAARAAGMPVAAVTYGYNHGQPIAASEPDLLVDSLAALI
jgi:phosphoglycolate phosphatase